MVLSVYDTTSYLLLHCSSAILHDDIGRSVTLRKALLTSLANMIVERSLRYDRRPVKTSDSLAPRPKLILRCTAYVPSTLGHCEVRRAVWVRIEAEDRLRDSRSLARACIDVLSFFTG
jgi:hypothetical protein